VPALRLDRGPAPAEDFAQDDLRGGVTLSSNDFRTPSALFRSLPIAASSVVAEPNVVSGWCATAAGLTHGHPEVWSTTALVGLLVGHHLTEVFRFGPWAALDAASTIRWFFRDMPENPSAKRLLQAVSSPLWSRDLLAALSPDDTSVSVLAGALYLFERARTLRPASIRVLAASAADPHAVASLAAALVGLEQGPRGLDTGELTRHELSWVVDTLARDFCVTIWSPPAYGGEMDALAEMSLRYPRES
jgi:ADP-ribosylglycohydrolase